MTCSFNLKRRNQLTNRQNEGERETDRCIEEQQTDKTEIPTEETTTEEITTETTEETTTEEITIGGEGTTAKTTMATTTKTETATIRKKTNFKDKKVKRGKGKNRASSTEQPTGQKGNENYIWLTTTFYEC